MVNEQREQLQTPWDCRWTRFECRVSQKAREASSAWVCVRDGRRRHILDEECEVCEHWETHESDEL